MLHIIAQFRQLFNSLMFNGFAEATNFKSENFNSLDKESRNQFIKNNTELVKNYLNSLDKTNDNKISYYNSDKGGDFFSLSDEISLKNVLESVGLDKYDLDEGVDLSQIVQKIDEFVKKQAVIIEDAKSQSKEVFLPKGYSNKLDYQTQSGHDVYLDNRDGIFVIRIDDYGTDDSIKLFKRYPTQAEINQALADYDMGGEQADKAAWGDESDFEDLKTALVGAKKEKVVDNTPIITPEKSGEVITTFGSTEKLADYKNNVNIKSFENIISNMSYSDLLVLVRQMEQIAGENHFDKETNELNYNLFNTGKLEDLFKSKGYEADGYFGPEEVASLFRLFSDTFETQQEFTNGNLNFKESIKILLDYNFDGLLDNIPEFYTKEKEFLLAIKSEKDFTNLLSSLGYNSYDDFKSKMANNYYNERNEFKTRLATVLDSDLNIQPVEMLISPDAVKDKVAIMNRINEEFEKNPTFQAIEAKDKRLADLIKYEGAGAIFGSMNGGAVSFDISKLTYNFIDSLAFGVVNGTLGFVVDKNLYTDDTFKLNVGAANFIPYVAGSAALYKSTMDDFKDIFPKKVDSGVKVTLGGTVFLTGSWGAGLDFSKLDEHTQEGIAQMKEKMGEKLDEIFDYISEGKTFSETGIPNTKENKQAYERLTGLYKSFGEKGISNLKQGALNNYEMDLYKNADGLNFAGISIGVISAFGYLAPVIGAHAEYHSTEWKQTQKAGENIYRTETKTVVDDYSKSVEGIETSNIDLKQAITNLDNTITFRTRTNKFADVIMNPNLSDEERWTGFENFANRKGKFSKELQTTINAFKEVINAADKENISPVDKKYILSSVVQFMKKSHDTKSGSIENYNSNYEELIAMKNKRRGSYNELLGFNTDIESKSFDEKLRSAGKNGTISEKTYSGLSFDAAASKQVGAKRETIKGVDVFLSNIQMLTDGAEPILVPIIDKAKIEAFVNKLSALNNIDPVIKQELIDGIKSGDIVLNYFNDPDGLDDRIIPLSKGGKEIINVEEREGIAVFKPSYDTDRYGLAFGMDVKDHKPSTPKGDGLSSTPGADDGGSTGTNGGTTNPGNTGGTTTGGGFGS
ncbi:MAG: hypothetical protein Q8K30_00340 [Candidatus Gracilibacteria bacterium]|nr:hypothetical protein [Candidatus Gracilibacteria bacterium]